MPGDFDDIKRDLQKAHPKRPDPRVEPSDPPVPRLGGLVAGKVRHHERPLPVPPVHPARTGRTLVTAKPAPPAPNSAPVPAVPLPAPELDSTLESAGAEPPRSLSPAPWERDSTVDAIEAEVSKRGDRVVRQAPAESTPMPRPPRSPSPPPSEAIRIPKSLLRKLAPWLVPAALSVVGLVSGYVITAWAATKQLAAHGAAIEAHEQEIARLTRAARDAKARADATDDALAAEAASNRAERATQRRAIEQLRGDVEKAVPKVQGLPPSKP